ncbi:CdaR family transcriptional regulator [Halopolyspora algeriensis]|uniref:CdaR family transcriptional regulator n=1 Tax=Halopolyspora algeriensis TaxID=1500506 RepID=A0A368VY08_9ACTN|nr:PucR family transcriptional regulator ligand-binding domain-containing protein [Halopolyspora algeriensis]RCW46250.1 CdaR family transcriptional regulator [Halopolyspora algeriensis]TQM55653.1 CdaR family transcriptional regulator [Halopolyspora algeriensis]
MPIPLSGVLSHPSLSPAEPVLLTGREHTARSVRWVHSSEILDIAPLLRGGELLLTGGFVLSEASPERQRRYIRELASRGVTGVAVETSEQGTGLPEALIDEAEQQGFALIQLGRTVPFVEVTESINAVLINDSVHRLRIADSLSDQLSTQLTSGSDLQGLAETLAASTDTHITVYDESGEPLAATHTAPQDPEESAEPLEAPITVHGVVTARLVLHPGPEPDPAVLDAALDRAPQAFGLALLRTRSPAPSSQATRALFHALQHPDHSETEFLPLVEASELSSAGTFVAVTAAHVSKGHLGALEHAMRRHGRQVLSHLAEGELLAIVALPSHIPEQARQTLVDDLRQAHDTDTRFHTLAVGPLARSTEHLPHTTAEARRCLEADLPTTAVRGVVDAADCSLRRLAHRLDADTALHDFVAEQLGGILQQPAQVRDRLLGTLETFFDCAASKTETAQRLHLRRQTLYQRLGKLSRCLGYDITGPDSPAALHVAVRLRQVLDRS